MLGKLKENIVTKMLNNCVFGAFLREKRRQQGMSLRTLANELNLSHSYLSCIENGKKPPPSDAVLIKIASILSMDYNSKLLLFDIASEIKSINSNDFCLSADISKYIDEKESLKLLIREADKCGCSDEFWNEILQKLKNMSH